MDILQQQAGFNSVTRKNWDLFASHREHTTRLICEATQRQEHVGTPARARGDTHKP